MQNLTKLEQTTLENINNERIFESITWGKLTFKEVIFRLSAFMLENSEAAYNVIIGTDSQVYKGQTVFVSALIVHRLGGGAIYFWNKKIEKGKYLALENRMFEEATRSIGLGQQFMHEFKVEGVTKFDLEIHVDVGSKGKTHNIINAVVGMIEGNGFVAKTKPKAFGAASVADRYT